MEPSEFYRMHQPTEWCEPPQIFSFSSLYEILECPLRWQLLHSKWNIFDTYPIRPSVAALEGQIIHEVLEALYSELASAGMPEPGSDEFIACFRMFDIYSRLNDIQARIKKKYEGNLRCPTVKFRSGNLQLRNRVIQLFRQNYQEICRGLKTVLPMGKSATKMSFGSEPKGTSCETLKRKRVLSEFKISHGSLPLTGRFDLIWLEKDKIKFADFKTGMAVSDHQRQIELYALLIENKFQASQIIGYTIYSDHLNEFVMQPDRLKEISKKIEKEISSALNSLQSKPAPAKLNENCKYCQVKQYCDLYWETFCPEGKNEFGGFCEIEGKVIEKCGDYGFLLQTNSSGNFNLVFEKEIGRTMRIAENQKLRIIKALKRKSEIEFTAQSEIFLFF
ncbi:MAG: PD-(D/E)XK nuclease family protein [Candidatus Riflebacteria bacterium]